MNKLFLVLLFVILVSGTAKASKGGGGSTGVGNGGFGIQCPDSPLLIQSIDFLEAKSEMGAQFKVHPVDSFEESLKRISGLISAKLPTMSQSFKEFVLQIGNKDPLQHYLWKEFGELPEPEAYVLNPDDRLAVCPNASDGEVAIIAQIFRRKAVPTLTPAGTRVIFYYDPSLLSKLSGVQRSFLLVHEWLWNFTNDVTANRKANYLLHSIWFDVAPSKEVIQQFKELRILSP